MGVLFDYFAAASDEEAATALESGPEPAFPTVAAQGIDPAVCLGTFGELLTGRDATELRGDEPRGPVAAADDYASLVDRIPAGLTAALAAAPDSRLAELAVPWSEIEEFHGAADPADLARTLRDLAALARAAQTSGHRLYCWMSL